MDPVIREMEVGDLSRIGEVDRSESVHALYVAELAPDGLGLALKRVPQDPPEQVPVWGEKGVAERVGWWQPELEKGGLLLGAFVGDTLAGFAVLGVRKKDDSADMCALFVGKGYRRIGMGELLAGEVEARARKRGVKALSVYSNPTESAIRFYMKHGYEIIGLFAKSTIKTISGDVVFAKSIPE